MFEKLKSSFNSLAQRISQKELSDKETAQILDDFLLKLVENDVAYSVAQKICDILREKLKDVEVRRFSNSTEPAKALLRDVLLDVLKGSGEEKFFKILDERRSEHKIAIVLFVGVNGTGKTSSIANSPY